MNRNERIEIKALQNGYKIERSWRERNTSENGLGWDYADEEFMFKTWDEVIEFITENKLDVPPARI